MSATSIAELQCEEWREVDQRRQDGLVVTLWMAPSAETFKVEVRDSARDGEDLDIYVVDKDDVRVAFAHPFSYAALPHVVAVPSGGGLRAPTSTIFDVDEIFPEIDDVPEFYA